jgi:diguanylate cyclase (GGDEF)-like protein
MRVLIADDDRVSRTRLEAFLRTWGYTVAAAADGDEALRILDEQDSPRLIVLDRTMPQIDGLEVCRRIRESLPEPYAYVILLTGQGRKEEIIEGFEAGADDYITKPFEVQELRARLRTGARIVELQAQLIAAREQVRVEAMYDSLTGVLNRAAFFDILQVAIVRTTRQRTALALMMVDLDHFKDINDRHGHLAGDVVLREAARRLRVSLRASDSIGRYGGEEFVILAPECSTADAAALAERCRASICSAPIVVPGASVTVTISVGVVGTLGVTESGQLLRAADEALYRAKHGGRDRVEVTILS